MCTQIEQSKLGGCLGAWGALSPTINTAIASTEHPLPLLPTQAPLLYLSLISLHSADNVVEIFLQPAGRDKVIQCRCLLGRGQGAPCSCRMNSLAYGPYHLCRCHSHMASTPAERRSRRTSCAVLGTRGQSTLPQTVSGFSRRVDVPRIHTLGTLVGVTASTSGTRGTRVLDCRLSGGSSAAVATQGVPAGTIAAILLGQRSVRNESIGKQGGWWEGPAWGSTNSSYQSRTQVRPIPRTNAQPPISFSVSSVVCGGGLIWLHAGNGAWGPEGRSVRIRAWL